ncbi:MAG: hypothetical protein F6J97_10980 [Leptolyngbya sp. SIO4C1]|nr:hypothetical protein [Leptolyngbya sp. SIO4C1]
MHKPAPWQLLLLLSNSLIISLTQPATAQEAPLKPTARYAIGEDVDLGQIIGEWRDPYPEIPIFACVCDDAVCDNSESWPFREFERYQLTVKLGPYNAGVAESIGFNCFDIETGRRPSELADGGIGGPDQPGSSLGIPTADVLDEGEQLRLSWPNGESNTIDVDGWNIALLDALDCQTLTQVPQKTFTARRIIGTPAVDAQTGNVAVPVLLEECVETQQSAIFVVDPQGVGSYALYRVQVPGEQVFPNEFSSYPLNSITGVQYWDSSLLVRHGTASGAEALLVFRPGRTPAGEWVSCGVVTPGEGDSRLCEQQAES